MFLPFHKSARRTHTNLCLWVNETDSMLVDGDQENLRKDWLRGLLKNIEIKQRTGEASYHV